MKYMRTIQVRTSTVKTLSFWTDHLDKQCKLRSACSLGIGLIRVYAVSILSTHYRTAITGQRPAVLAAGTGWKLSDLGGGGGGGISFSTLTNGVLPENETVKLFFFFFFFFFAFLCNIQCKLY